MNVHTAGRYPMAWIFSTFPRDLRDFQILEHVVYAWVPLT
ncbi:hypothetical protein P3T16_002474 [Paraburkholderia sp. GAS42]